ncbi:MAG: hypothetical protein OIN83_12275 [Candidatus Methanoperedens sp.]|nr:hypothetical protein [Candidatus Methanoperedens sp.]
MTVEFGYVVTLTPISLTAAMTLVPAYTTMPAFPALTTELSTASHGVPIRAIPTILAFAAELRTSSALERAESGIS